MINDLEFLEEFKKQMKEYVNMNTDLFMRYQTKEINELKKQITKKILIVKKMISEKNPDYNRSLFENIFNEDPYFEDTNFEPIYEVLDQVIGYLEIENIKNQKIEVNTGIKSKQHIGEKSKEFDKTKVFIVHGHDDTLKLEVARVIEKLKLKAIILHEQANKGKTIIEKLEEHTDVGYGIVLYTPCDKGFKNGEFLKSRARQNVVFEHGLLIGKLGRERVATLVKGDVDLPGDISGTVYTSIGNEWKFSLVGELRSLGYDVDANNLF